MSTEKFRSLPPRERALVAISVLLDGSDAANHLGYDALRGEELSSAVRELVALEPEMRVLFVGTMLRLALEEIG